MDWNLAERFVLGDARRRVHDHDDDDDDDDALRLDASRPLYLPHRRGIDRVHGNAGEKEGSPPRFPARGQRPIRHARKYLMGIRRGNPMMVGETGTRNTREHVAQRGTVSMLEFSLSLRFTPLYSLFLLSFSPLFPVYSFPLHYSSAVTSFLSGNIWQRRSMNERKPLVFLSLCDLTVIPWASRDYPLCCLFRFVFLSILWYSDGRWEYTASTECKRLAVEYVWEEFRE